MSESSITTKDYATVLAAARDQANSMPLEDIDVTDWSLFRTNTHWPYFERLRREAPVYFP